MSLCFTQSYMSVTISTLQTVYVLRAFSPTPHPYFDSIPVFLFSRMTSIMPIYSLDLALLVTAYEFQLEYVLSTPNYYISCESSLSLSPFLSLSRIYILSFKKFLSITLNFFFFSLTIMYKIILMDFRNLSIFEKNK